MIDSLIQILEVNNQYFGGIKDPGADPRHLIYYNTSKINEILTSNGYKNERTLR